MYPVQMLEVAGDLCQVLLKFENSAQHVKLTVDGCLWEVVAYKSLNHNYCSGQNIPHLLFSLGNLRRLRFCLLRLIAYSVQCICNFSLNF